MYVVLELRPNGSARRSTCDSERCDALVDHPLARAIEFADPLEFVMADPPTVRLSRRRTVRSSHPRTACG
jgi:hypothetical protein